MEDSPKYKIRHHDEILAIELTEAEKEEALYEWKLRKFFKNRVIHVIGVGQIKASDYWAAVDKVRETRQLNETIKLKE